MKDNKLILTTTHDTFGDLMDWVFTHLKSNDQVELVSSYKNSVTCRINQLQYRITRHGYDHCFFWSVLRLNDGAEIKLKTKDDIYNVNVGDFKKIDANVLKLPQTPF